MRIQSPITVQKFLTKQYYKRLRRRVTRRVLRFLFYLNSQSARLVIYANAQALRQRSGAKDSSTCHLTLKEVLEHDIFHAIQLPVELRQAFSAAVSFDSTMILFDTPLVWLGPKLSVIFKLSNTHVCNLVRRHRKRVAEGPV